MILHQCNQKSSSNYIKWQRYCLGLRVRQKKCQIEVGAPCKKYIAMKRKVYMFKL